MSAVGLALALFAPPATLAEPNDEREAVVLAAVPEFDDPYWARTVLLAAPMPSGGHLGLILNRPTLVSLATAFPRHAPSKMVRDPIYVGGPFAAGAIVALLTAGEAPGAGAVPLGERLYLAFDATLIDRIIEQAPNDARYFAGLVIWHPGELRGEIDRGFWSVHRAEKALLFRSDTGRLWRELADRARGLETRAPAGESPASAGACAAQAARARSAITAARNRPASPPLTARWSKVRLSGMSRCTAGTPSTATTRFEMRPAPRIATVGGSTTGAAYLPAIMPKLDSVMV